MTPRTQKLKRYNSTMAKVINDNPEAKTIENRYRLIRRVLMEVYPNLIESVSKETFMEMLKDADYLGRQARLFNEGNQEDLKEELSSQKIVELKS